LVKFKFKWFPKIDLKDSGVHRVLRLMGPRLVSMVFIQLIFLAQDNLASRLPVGSVTALSFGWWIQQVPETMIGTAIATALLPTLSDHLAEGEYLAFKKTIERSLKVMIALSLPVAVILSLTSMPLIQFAFGFGLEESQLVLWAAQGFLLGLLGHAIVELGVRSFFANQKPHVPMMVSGLGFAVFIALAIPLMGTLASSGIAIANSISYSLQAALLVLLLNRGLPERFQLGGSFLRGGISALGAAVGVGLILFLIPTSIPAIFLSLMAIAVSTLVAVIPIRQEIRLLFQL